MIKTLSAALVAVSMIAAPAFAGTAVKSDTAPVSKSAAIGKPLTAPVANAKAQAQEQVKAPVKHLRKHASHRHHRHFAAHRTHKHVALHKHHAVKHTMKHQGKQHTAHVQLRHPGKARG